MVNLFVIYIIYIFEPVKVKKHIENEYSTGQVNMPYAVNYSLRQGRHGNGIAVRVLADEQIVGKFEGMVLICDTIDGKWAEAFVRMHIDGVELLSLQGIILQCTVIGDASAAYPGTPCGVLIFNMFS